MTNQLQPKWYTLESRRKGAKKKGTRISGEVQLQFTLVDTSDPSAHSKDVLQKLAVMAAISPEDDEGDEDDDEDLARLDSIDPDSADEDEDEIDGKNPETSDSTDEPGKPAKAEKKAEKRRRKLRLKRLKKRAKARAYEFTGGTDVVGIVFLEIGKIIDLPPERNSEPTRSWYSRRLADLILSDKDWI